MRRLSPRETQRTTRTIRSGSCQSKSSPLTQTWVLRNEIDCGLTVVYLIDCMSIMVDTVESLRDRHTRCKALGTGRQGLLCTCHPNSNLPCMPNFPLQAWCLQPWALTSALTSYVTSLLPKSPHTPFPPTISLSHYGNRLGHEPLTIRGKKTFIACTGRSRWQ